MTYALTFIAGYCAAWLYALVRLRLMQRQDRCEICGGRGEITTMYLRDCGLSGKVRLCGDCWLEDVNAEVSQ